MDHESMWESAEFVRCRGLVVEARPDLLAVALEEPDVTVLVQMPPPTMLAEREFYAFREVDYAFTAPPESFRAPEAPASFRRVVDYSWMTPEAIVRESSFHDWPQVFPRAYAEGQLQGGNRTPALAEAYCDYCVRNGCESDAHGLLRSLGLGPDLER